MSDSLTIKDYEEVITDYRRLVRDLDIAMHGERGAAAQASLCDLIQPARMLREENIRLRQMIVDATAMHIFGDTNLVGIPEDAYNKMREYRHEKR